MDDKETKKMPQDPGRAALQDHNYCKVMEFNENSDKSPASTPGGRTSDEGYGSDKMEKPPLHCCPVVYEFKPLTMYCAATSLCYIRPYTTYYSWNNKFVICAGCYNRSKVAVNLDEEADDDDLFQRAYPKKDWVRMENNVVQDEPIVTCWKCDKSFHQICVRHHKAFGAQYTCGSCRDTKADAELQRKILAYSAEKLDKTRLSIRLEEKVNAFLRTLPGNINPVIVRVLSASDKKLEVKDTIKEYFSRRECLEDPPPPPFPEDFTYRNKVIMAYQQIDGAEIAFFALIVHEFGSDVPQPNQNRVYISFLDSVFFFSPKEYRTQVYHEIFLGYLEWAKEWNFQYAHLWACPPQDGVDYIFYAHPPEQKMPEAQMLQNWYKNLLEKGKQRGSIHDYKNILDYCLDKKVKNLAELPYFEGDYWISAFERAVRLYDDGGPPQPKKRKKGRKPPPPWNYPLAEDEEGVLNYAMREMNDNKEGFWIVELNKDKDAKFSTVDPDPLIACPLMENREQLLIFARENKLEFSSLRRAKYSTMFLMHQTHVEISPHITCSVCSVFLRPGAKVRYECTVCKEYDICEGCFKTVKHPHPMNRITDIVPPHELRIEKKPWMTSFLATRKLQRLEHSKTCKNVACSVENCSRFRWTIRHLKSCGRKMPRMECSFCLKYKIIMHAHFSLCDDPMCTLLGCPSIKQKKRLKEFKKLVELHGRTQQRSPHSQRLL